LAASGVAVANAATSTFCVAFLRYAALAPPTCRRPNATLKSVMEVAIAAVQHIAATDVLSRCLVGRTISPAPRIFAGLCSQGK
jgi:hypothetical protein